MFLFCTGCAFNFLYPKHQSIGECWFYKIIHEFLYIKRKLSTHHLVLSRTLWSHIFSASWGVRVSQNTCTAVQSTTRVLECSHCASSETVLAASELCMCRGRMSVSITHIIARVPADILMPTWSARQNSVCSKVTTVEWPLQGERKKCFKGMLKYILNRKAVLWNSGKIAPDGPSWHTAIRNSKNYFKQKKYWGISLCKAKRKRQWAFLASVSKKGLGFNLRLVFESLLFNLQVYFRKLPSNCVSFLIWKSL